MNNKDDTPHPHDVTSTSTSTSTTTATATTTTTTTCPNIKITPPKSQQDCNAWKSKGRCKRKEKGILFCPYRHDESIKQIAIERNRQKMIFDTQQRKQQKQKQQRKQNQQQHPLGICLCSIDDDDDDESSSSSFQEEPKIIYENGLRHIQPYWIIVSLSLQKYVGMTIVDALNKHSEKKTSSSRTMKRPPPEYWKQQLSNGTLILYENSNNHHHNDGYKIIATPDHIIEKSNIIKGKYHFHEESILLLLDDDDDVIIVYEDSDYLIVNKPAGIDVYVNQNAGRVYNSLPGILYTNYNVRSKIYPAHRIDNNVSGLVCFGKTIAAQKRLTHRIKFRETIKTYLACVCLPTTTNKENNNCDDDDDDDDYDDSSSFFVSTILENKKLPMIIDVPLGFDSNSCLAVVIDDDNNNNNNNNNDDGGGSSSSKNKSDNSNVISSSENGKECKTTIVRCLGRGGGPIVGGDNDSNASAGTTTTTTTCCRTAILEVQPNTGRRHQLRKHLQHVGLCIANDERYGGTMNNENKISAFWGTATAATTTTTKTIKKDDDEDNNNNESGDRDYRLGQTSSPCLPISTSSSTALEEMLSSSYFDDCSFCKYAKNLFDSAKQFKKSGGDDNGIVGSEGNRNQQQRQQQQFGPTVSTGIWLHSWRYEFPTLDLSFETPIPDWAKT